MCALDIDVLVVAVGFADNAEHNLSRLAESPQPSNSLRSPFYASSSKNGHTLQRAAILAHNRPCDTIKKRNEDDAERERAKKCQSVDSHFFSRLHLCLLT